MNNKLEAAQNKFLESVSRMCDAFGLNSFLAKLYAYLYLHANPTSLDEMAKALGVSKGSVSINIRELESLGAVKKIWMKGSRKDYYEAESDIKKVFTSKLRSAIQKRITEVSDMTREFNDIISSAEGELTQDEISIARGYQDRMSKINEIKTLASAALSFTEKLL